MLCLSANSVFSIEKLEDTVNDWDQRHAQSVIVLTVNYQYHKETSYREISYHQYHIKEVDLNV